MAILENQLLPNYTEWVKHRVDSSRAKFDFHDRQGRSQNPEKCNFLSAISKENS